MLRISPGEYRQRLEALQQKIRLGLGNHEAPWISEDGEDQLSVEPRTCLKGIGGIRHRDTVLVSENGHELLTRFPISWTRRHLGLEAYYAT